MLNRNITKAQWAQNGIIWLLVILAPLIIAFIAFKGWQWDFSVPFYYEGHDDTWQLILTKWLLDNGWILNNPFLGAPDIAHGHYNSAAQTSSLHSLIMKLIGIFITDSVRVQNYYYFLNFSLISLTSYAACRLVGVSRLFAVPAGILFSLGLTRLYWPFFAFIPNYFMVPLAVVVIVWSAKGEFIDGNSKNFVSALNQLKVSRKFWLSLLIVFLVALSDGYYAFFTVLLLSLSSVMVLFHKPRLKIVYSLVPLCFAAIILSTVLLMMMPLSLYHKAHPEEFFPGGVQDPSLTIHPFEAEVYATSLKIMLMPNLHHQIDWLAHIGQTMHESAAMPRKFGYYEISGQLGSAAGLGFLMLLSVFLFPKWILGNKFVNGNNVGTSQQSEVGVVLYMLAVFAGFIFICETVGGVGSLIAFLYPYIRAYDRFSIFLIFVVLLAAGLFLTYVLSIKAKRSPIAWIVVGIATSIFILDQIPVNIARSMELPHVKRFLAERDLVHAIENSLKPGDMVYQYPYAQYMAPSSYYGMGSQAQMRSYLHSHYLRWSNGASKNSWVDVWHRNLAQLPPEELFHELAAYGFKGMLVDRWVVKDNEFQSIANAARSIGAVMTFENSTAKMAYFKFPDYGFHLVMDKHFKQPEQIIFHKNVQIDYAQLPLYINSESLKSVISREQGELPSSMNLREFPEVLDINLFSAMRGGLDESLPKDELLGDVTCGEPSVTYISGEGEIHLKLRNNSKIPRKLNSGSRPITIGYHITDFEGKVMEWDNGYRYRSKQILLEPGKEQEVTIKLRDLGLIKTNKNKINILFELLQDGNAWFGVNPENKVCTVREISMSSN